MGNYLFSRHILLIVAVFLSLVTRGYLLGQVPAGLYIDEAGQGYSAYSILKTGKDEFGMNFPAVFRSFTDFKTPVYVYSVVPLIPLFGLTPLSVRLPSFLASLATIFVLYALLRHFTKRDSLVPGITVVLLAISPWHILFGRTNFECNLALLLLLLGIYCFLKAATKPMLYAIAFVFFAIAFPAYHAQRIVTPLMVLYLLVTQRQYWTHRTARRWIILGICIAVGITLPTFIVATTPGFLARASGLNIFSQLHQKPAGYLFEASGVLGTFANSSLFLSLREFLALYTSYFSPRYLFLLGDFGPRSSFPALSTFFLWQLPFYLVGLWILLKTKVPHELRNFTLFFLLISPLPAAVTRDPYSTIRALQMVVPLSILIALGIETCLSSISKKVSRGIVLVSVLGILLYSLLKLYSSVIVLNEYYRARDWDYGWSEVAEVLKNVPAEKTVIVDNSREEAYIELLFFMKYDPVRYQADHPFNLANYYTDMHHETEKRIGNITTRPINWETDLAPGNILVGDELAISDSQMKEHRLKLITDIFYPNGELAFRITEVNNNN